MTYTLTDSEPKPEALHIGFSKCASTFLQRYFADHPDIFLVNQSHYFSPFDFDDYSCSQTEYSRMFAGAAPTQLRLESDEHILLPLFHPVLKTAATTLEAVTEVSRRIQSVNAAARIIVIVRNQVGLIASRYSEYVLGGGTLPFDVFVNEFLECSTDGRNYYENYYFTIAEILFAAFGEENVLILTQEGLAANEDETMDRLCRFLGIRTLMPTFRDSVSKRVGLSDLGIRVVRQLNQAVVTRQEMSSRKAEVRIPYLLYKTVQRGLREIDYRLPKRLKGDRNEMLSEEIRSRIRATFADDNARLERLLAIDLTAYGY